MLPDWESVTDCLLTLELRGRTRVSGVPAVVFWDKGALTTCFVHVLGVVDR